MTGTQATTQLLATRWTPIVDQARPWQPPLVPTLVVAPHPDDEVLSTGGLILRQRTRGAHVEVLAVTDGEAAYPEVTDLGPLRAGEQRGALDILGVSADDTCRLGLPDGGVASHEDALVEAIVARATNVGLIVAPWTGDHHTDHEACGRAAERAAGMTQTPLVFGLFWTWHHADIDQVAKRRLVKVVLARHERQARHRALQQHRSQITADIAAVPVLSPIELEPFTWNNEYYIPSDSGS